MAFFWLSTKEVCARDGLAANWLQLDCHGRLSLHQAGLSAARTQCAAVTVWLIRAAAGCRKKLDDQYHFSCQFTADLIAMNASDFIITSTFQEIAGDADTVGAFLCSGRLAHAFWGAQLTRGHVETADMYAIAALHSWQLAQQ